jgi:hypothetical protein
MTDTQQFILELLRGAPGGIAALIGILYAIRARRLKKDAKAREDDLDVNC